MKLKNLKHWTFLLNVVVASFFQMPLTYADVAASPSPTASTTSLDEFDKICKEVLKTSPPPTDPQKAQKYQYCKAADDAKDAANASETLWKVWAAVGGICAAACLASFAGITNQYVCIGFSAGAGVTDAIVTKNFMSGLMGLAGAGGALMVNKMMNDGSAKPRDIGACVAAAAAAFQVYSKYNSMQSSLKSAQSSLTSAAGLVADSSIQSTFDAASNLTSNNSAGNSANSNVQGTQDTAGVNSPTTSSTLCNSVSNAGMMVQCAVASDSTLPSFVNSPRFPDDFKKSSGMNLDTFLAKNDPPGKMLATSMGGTMNPTQAMKLTASIKQMEQQLDVNPTSSVYASGGRVNSGGDSDLPMGDLMASLINQLNPKKGEEGQNPGVNQVIFANQHQPISSIPENKTLGIFDRVTYRYFLLGNRMLEGKL